MVTDETTQNTTTRPSSSDQPLARVPERMPSASVFTGDESLYRGWKWQPTKRPMARRLRGSSTPPRQNKHDIESRPFPVPETEPWLLECA